MLGYRVNNIEKVEPGQAEEFFSEGTYIILMYANRIPPHLSFLYEGLAYSLSVKGRKVGAKFEDIQRVINTKKIECLFFKLKNPEFGGNHRAIHRLLKIVINKYSLTDPLIATCL